MTPERETRPLQNASLQPGARLGPYEIEAQLGEGGMGEVWKARDTRLGRTVAIKVSKTEFSQRFEREARAVAGLNHPHICTLYDVGPNYFVMEYIDGKPLQQVIPRKGLTLSQVLNYASQVADALAAAHAAGIVHRDLKPGNIMITSEGRVKVVDFGLARVSPSDSFSPDDATVVETAEGVIAGTVSYMSPEQAQGRPVDARSDIFSFGAVVYEMLTGARAFHGDSPMSTLADVLNKTPKPAGEVTGDLPREVDTLVMRCLRKDPSRRWQNMADVKVALLELKEDSESGRLTVALPLKSQSRSVNPLWFAVAVALVVVAAGAGWFFARNGQPAATASFTALPLTSYPGSQAETSFSPDGNQVAFAWNGPHRDNWDIYVKVVGGGEPLRITSSPAEEYSPSWSPDGRWIAFARTLDGKRYALVLISPLGGVERKLGEFGMMPALDPGVAWSKDSRYLVLSSLDEVHHTNGLIVLSLDSGETRTMTTAPSESLGDERPTLSPDGLKLAFTRVRDNASGDLMTLEVSSDLKPLGQPRLVVRQSVGVAWTADGKELLYSSGTTFDNFSIKRIPVSGGSPQPVGPAIDGAYSPSISRPAPGAPSHLAWTHRFRDSNIYRLKIGLPGREAEPESLIASPYRDVFPQYSPDGKSIAFYSARSGNTEIWSCQADGSGCRQLTALAARVSGSPRWSPDGSQVLFDSNKEGAYELYVVSSDGGTPKRLTEQPSSNFAGNWSPDGKTIYFTSNRGGGQLNVWRMPASGGPAEQVTHHEGNGSIVSPDGKFLYYVKDISGGTASLWRLPVAGGGEAQVIPVLHRYSFAVTRRGIYFMVPDPSKPGGTIEFMDLESGKRSVLAHTDKSLELGISVSPDGQNLVFPQIDYEGSNLMMIENFH